MTTDIAGEGKKMLIIQQKEAESLEEGNIGHHSSRIVTQLRDRVREQK